MESDFPATLILSIDTVEVYQTSDKGNSLVTKGPLSVLYIAAYNCFIIQVKEFTYHLSKEIPVLASSNPEKGGLASYVFPNFEGYYIIKVIQIQTLEGLGTFETILNNHCELAYEQQQEVQEEERGLVQARVESQEKAVKSSAAPKKTNTEIATSIIYKGGVLARTGLVKGAEALSKGIAKAGEFVQNKYVKKSEGKDLNESTVNQVKIVNTTTGAVAKLTQVQIQGIITVGKEIGKELARKAAKSEAGQKFENFKHRDTVVKVGTSTLNAAANIFVGMYEALSVLGKGIGDTTTKIVAHKYGDKAGQATKQGFEAVGNIGKIAEIVTIEGSKAVQEGTMQKQKANC